MAKPRAGWTFFHNLWLAGALGSAFFGFAFLRHTTLLVRLALALLGGVIGLLVFHLAIVLLVIYVVIPRLRRGSGWEYEVDCYMRSVVGSDWPD